MIAALINYYHCCLASAKMARPGKGCPTPRLQLEGNDEPETILNTPQQEGHPDVAEGKVIADYDPDVDDEGLEPNVETVTQEQREVDPDAEYVMIEMPRDETLCQRMMTDLRLCPCSQRIIYLA